MRKAIPIALATACGLLTLVDFFVPHALIDSLGAKLVEGVMILAAFALLLGVLNLLATHGRRIVGGQRRAGLSLVLVVALLGTLATGVTMPGSAAMAWVFDYLYYPLQSSMAALLAFFLVTALYRAFRLRSFEAGLLLATSLVMLALQLPFVAAISRHLVAVRDWLYAVPITAGARGILLGSALGIMATSLRVLLAVDHPYT